MEDNKYSRREFISKKLLTVSVFAGGTIFFGLGSLASLARNNQDNTRPITSRQTKPHQTKPHQTKRPVKKPATATTPPSNNPCDDMADVPASDLEKRKQLAYVTKSPVPDKHCSVCALYLKPKPDTTCGRCALFKGPVRPEGACAYWAPIAT
jgi:hypothetical protein